MSLVSKLLQRLRWLVRSSTLRLSLLLSLIFAIGMSVAIFVAIDFGEDAVLRQIDSSLEDIAATTTLDDASRNSASLIIRAVSDLDNLPRPFERVVQRGGGTIDLDRDFRRSEFWRVLVSRDSVGKPIFLAVPVDDTENALSLLGGILWTTVSVVVLLTLAIGLGAGLLAQRRTLRINDTLNRLAAGDLSARTDHQGSRDDLDDIARQLDQTALSLERLVSQTRQLSASIAHDLRTPLARLRSRLEMLPEGEARGAALEEASRLSDIFDTIMRVARIEAGHGRDGFERVVLGDLVAEMAETFGPVVEDAGKSLIHDTKRGATVLADRQMLVQALANLIQNALIHGGTEVTLFADDHRIGVADNGPGVDPEKYQEIVKPMVRLDAAREMEGTGLGLALVRAVADRHSAQLDLAPHTPTGLRVTLNFAKL